MPQAAEPEVVTFGLRFQAICTLSQWERPISTFTIQLGDPHVSHHAPLFSLVFRAAIVDQAPKESGLDVVALFTNGHQNGYTPISAVDASELQVAPGSGIMNVFLCPWTKQGVLTPQTHESIGSSSSATGRMINESIGSSSSATGRMINHLALVSGAYYVLIFECNANVLSHIPPNHFSVIHHTFFQSLFPTPLEMCHQTFSLNTRMNDLIPVDNVSSMTWCPYELVRTHQRAFYCHKALPNPSANAMFDKLQSLSLMPLKDERSLYINQQIFDHYRKQAHLMDSAHLFALLPADYWNLLFFDQFRLNRQGAVLQDLIHALGLKPIFTVFSELRGWCYLIWWCEDARLCSKRMTQIAGLEWDPPKFRSFQSVVQLLSQPSFEVPFVYEDETTSTSLRQMYACVKLAQNAMMGLWNRLLWCHNLGLPPLTLFYDHAFWEQEVLIFLRVFQSHVHLAKAQYQQELTKVFPYIVPRIEWPHSFQVLDLLSKLGWRHSPTLLQHDRMICERCGRERSGWWCWESPACVC
jgi:hypothetical protein